MDGTQDLVTTPLILASEQGHFDVCEYLIQKGCDVNIQSASYETAIDLAESNDHENIIQLLIPHM